MNIKHATAADCAILASLNQQLIRDEGHRNKMSVHELEDRMLGWLDSEYTACLFFADSEVIGYALFRTEPDFIYLRQFFVHPDFRRQGLGRAAFQWLNKNVWRNSRLRIDVLSGNEVAIQFWRSLGFADYCMTMELG